MRHLPGMLVKPHSEARGLKLLDDCWCRQWNDSSMLVDESEFLTVVSSYDMSRRNIVMCLRRDMSLVFLDDWDVNEVTCG